MPVLSRRAALLSVLALSAALKQTLAQTQAASSDISEARVYFLKELRRRILFGCMTVYGKIRGLKCLGSGLELNCMGTMWIQTERFGRHFRRIFPTVDLSSATMRLFILRAAAIQKVITKRLLLRECIETSSIS